MEESFWWVWKFMLQALGGSIFLLPYVAGQVGLFAFSLILIGEAIVTGNTMIMFRNMAQKDEPIDPPKEGCRQCAGSLRDKHTLDYKRCTSFDAARSEFCERDNGDNEGFERSDSRGDSNERQQYMMRTNYFTIVSNFLDKSDSNFWYGLIRFIFLLEVVVCNSFYFKAFVDLFFEAGWITNLSPNERPGYHVLIHMMFALFVIAIEDFTEKMDNHRPPLSRTESKTTLKIRAVGIMNIYSEHETANQRRNMIDMPAVFDKLHGYSWKRCCLFFVFWFFITAIVQLNFALPDTIRGAGGINSSYACPGLFKPTFYVEPSWHFLQDSVLCMSIVLLALMHFAIFLPICLEELKLPEKRYSQTVRLSSVAFIVIFLFFTTFGNYILGRSAPVLFPTAFGSNIYGFSVNVIASLFVVVAMLLRIMACCRLIQVLFRSQSDSAYWIIVSLLFVISYWISHSTSSVLYLAIFLGGGTSNLLLIVFPRFAYLEYLRKEKNETSIQAMVCAIAHMLLLLTWVLSGLYYILTGGESAIDVRIGENCSMIFNDIWTKKNYC